MCYPHSTGSPSVGKMGPYEIEYAGGSVEHFNGLSGSVWLQRLLGQYPKAVWFNPQPENWWDRYHSIIIINQLMHKCMYPLTLDGLNTAIKTLLLRYLNQCLLVSSAVVMVCHGCFLDSINKNTSAKAGVFYLRSKYYSVIGKSYHSPSNFTCSSGSSLPL
jgi:hypothetical protein